MVLQCHFLKLLGKPGRSITLAQYTHPSGPELLPFLQALCIALKHERNKRCMVLSSWWLLYLVWAFPKEPKEGTSVPKCLASGHNCLPRSAWWGQARRQNGIKKESKKTQISALTFRWIRPIFYAHWDSSRTKENEMKWAMQKGRRNNQSSF